MKIASMELNNPKFLRYIGQKRVPIILSTGMSTIEEVEEKIKDLLYTYVISDIEVVKRYEITSLIAVEEMKPESKESDGDDGVDDEF